MPKIEVKGHVVTIDNSTRPLTTAGLHLMVNSPAQQIINIDIDGEKLAYVGRGDRRTLADVKLSDGFKIITATFEHKQDGIQYPSNLRLGGPYSIGNSSFGIIIAENAHGGEYDDVIFRIDGKMK